MSLAIGIHQFFELGGIFYFEHNFLSILHYTISYTWLLTLRLIWSALVAWDWGWAYSFPETADIDMICKYFYEGCRTFPQEILI